MKYLLVPLAFAVIANAHSALYRFHTVSAVDAGRVRVSNLADAAAQVEIRAFDASGKEYGPSTLSLEARQGVTLTASELEEGAPTKGLPDGIGDGDGSWQLDLRADVELGGLSYLIRNGSITVVAHLESIRSMEHFLRVHRLVDRIDSDAMHESLSAYDWTAHQTVNGVDLGWGQQESGDGGASWTRYSGHLSHSAFALRHRIHNGESAAHVDVYGVSPEACGNIRTLPSFDSEWRGAVVRAFTDGTLGYAPIIATLRAGQVDFPGMSHHEFQAAIHALDLRLPYGFFLAPTPGGT